VAEPDATLAELRAVPYGHWKTTTLFRTYVEKVLAPTLRPGTLVPQRFGDLRYPTFA
jgi:hypothetical protein